jgi:hypothetical protein
VYDGGVSRVALGLKAHSGWAALVALSEEPRARSLTLVDRQRLELVDPKDAVWARQPYHAAEGLDPADAEDVVRRAIAAAHAHAGRALARALASLRAGGDEVVGCGVLLGSGMPRWSVGEILAVHMRMHKAEGELFREALVAGATRAGLGVMGIREKELEVRAAEALRLPPQERGARLAEVGRRAGAPWARDQKEAALAAWIALRDAAR